MTSTASLWPEVTLANIMAGGLFIDGDWVETKDQNPKGTVRLTQLADIGDGVWRDRSDRYMTADKAEALRCTFLEPGDVLVARMPDPLGRACLFPGDSRRAVTVVDVCIMRPLRERIEPKWLMWMMNSPQMRSRIAALQSGTTRKRISRRNLASLSLRLPPIEEQRGIVEIVEEQVSRLEAAASSLGAAKVKLEVLRKTAFLGVANTSSAKRRVEEVARIVSGQTPKGLRITESGEIPFFKVGDMNASDGYLMTAARSYVSAAEAKRSRLRVHPAGTVVFPKRGGAIATNKKRVLSHPGAFDLNTMGLVPGLGIDSTYLLYWLEGIDLGRLADGSNIPQINNGDIAPLCLPVPSVDDQRRIVADIANIVTFADRLLSAVEEALRRAKRERSAILMSAFSGRLVTEG